MAITQSPWDLHRSGSRDAVRHREKLKDAFKEKLYEIISQENIITGDKGKVVKVPIKALDSYRFIFDPKKQEHVAQGDGKTKKGDVVGEEAEEGNGSRAGDADGEEYYDAEIGVEDLIDMMMEDLALPRLDPKKKSDLTTIQYRYDDIRKRGPMSAIDKKRSLIENLKRNAQIGDPHVGGLRDDDLRFRTWTEKRKRVTSAVVIPMVDSSASMTEDKKYLARSFFFWMVNFLRKKYDQVAIEFVSHTTEAKVCSEDDFFHRVESGGTKCSSAYRLALDLIETQYSPDRWNIFVFHFSDGDTFGDVDLCCELVEKLCQTANMVGYAEIGKSWSDTLKDSYDKMDMSNFVTSLIMSKEDVWPALQKFFVEDFNGSE